MRVAQACPNQGVRRGRTKVFVVSGQSVVFEVREKEDSRSTRTEEKYKEAALVGQSYAGYSKVSLLTLHAP